MPIDPDLQNILNLYRQLPPFDPSISVEEYRRNMNNVFEMIAKMSQEEVKKVEDRVIKGRNGDLRIRIYQQSPDSPVLVYYHGGGFVLCNLETHDGICRRIAKLSDATVVSVDYRLAPEHKFPSAVLDAYDALKWVADHAEEIGVDKDKIFVAGDSAGGNLATVASMIARDEGEEFVKGQILVYPVVNLSTFTPSKLEFGRRGILTEEIMAWFNRHYLNKPEEALDWRASPIYADLSNLPPALIVTAEYDPLRDEGEMFGALMRKMGSEAVTVRYNGMLHGFLNFYPIVRAGKELIAQIAGVLRTI
ncbi:MAG: alpha/beta hydrolase fold domain-containing protein [Archaeoglobaceae archaeon]|nr:alpha/beta hydrolase fold domain-containing protein [Archaeoglobaceae archaeon]MDW8128584.1 alpha/beta hydrolase fold domain-containing protein [Archaeoglobaceae archaeon]